MWVLETNTGPLQEQQVLLTTESPLYPPAHLYVAFIHVRVPVETISVSEFGKAYP